MSDLTLKPVPALEGAPIGHFGASPTARSVAMTAMPEGHVWQIFAATLSNEEIAQATSDGEVHAAGPGQWFVIGDAPLAPPLALFDGRATLIDQSHGRVRIRLEGEAVTAMLAKGVAIDLHDHAFPVGRSVITLSGHVSVHLTRRAPDAFELMVLRSYALSLWKSLIEMGLEFGIEAHVPTA